LVSPESSCLCGFNSIEPLWYGPVCPVVWEGWRRETSPYPDQSLESTRPRAPLWQGLQPRMRCISQASRCVEDGHRGAAGAGDDGNASGSLRPKRWLPTICLVERPKIWRNQSCCFAIPISFIELRGANKAPTVWGRAGFRRCRLLQQALYAL
jgi:hypothetical protein